MYFYKEDAPISPTIKEINVMKTNSPRNHGRWLIPLYNSAFPQENVMHMRGNLLEIGRAFFIKQNTKNNLDSLVDLFLHYC